LIGEGRFEAQNAMDILERLDDLHKQATTERSHYYVAKCVKDAIAEIVLLRTRIAVLNQMYAELAKKVAAQ
jgi:hypothetical protein